MSYPYCFGYPQNIQPGTSGYSGVSEASSIEEVKAASVPYGVALFMMNNGEDVFYAKNSQGAMKAFRYEEVPIPSNDPSNFVSRQEFMDLKEKYEQLIARQHAAATAQPAATVQPAATSQPSAASGIVAGDATAQHDAGASGAGVLQPGGFNEPNQVTGGAAS